MASEAVKPRDAATGDINMCAEAAPLRRVNTYKHGIALTVMSTFETRRHMRQNVTHAVTDHNTPSKPRDCHNDTDMRYTRIHGGSVLAFSRGFLRPNAAGDGRATLLSPGRTVRRSAGQRRSCVLGWYIDPVLVSPER